MTVVFTITMGIVGISDKRRVEISATGKTLIQAAEDSMRLGQIKLFGRSKQMT